nr:integrase, catalytic region, zinc finger, CCHC-type, peptidase aspartic, catalytic [Tanacetum cinerariifolium]
MQGSSLKEQQKKETLFDRYERFQANRNESIHDYFVQFHKLINDMKITKMKIPVHQRNTKFVNNLPSYWGKKHDQPLHLHNMFLHHLSMHLLHNKLLSNKDKHAATGSQGKVVTCYNFCGQGHMAKEFKEKKRAKDSQWFKDKTLLMEAKEKGAILDAEDETFLEDVECTTPYAEPLAITTTTEFEVSHEDAYDSDVDEAPHAAAAFMANLMQTGPSTGHGTSNDTDFHLEDLQKSALGHRNPLYLKSAQLCRPTLIKNDSLTDENVSIKKHYQDLYQSKAKSNCNVGSGAVVPEKPKVLALGLYAMTPK